MSFKVTKQYPRGADTFCADFSDMNDAKNYIAEKLGEETAMNIKVTYRIYEFGEMMNEYDATNMPKSTKIETKSDTGAQGKGSGVSFKPTPFNTTPRPKGGPQGWVKDEDEEEKK